MTRKDFIALADAFARTIFEVRKQLAGDTESIVVALASIGRLRLEVEAVCAHNNPAFQSSRFRDRIEATYERLINPLGEGR